ncbi:MAG TPA: alpha/beta hydrolase family protein [Fimbriimonadaceae bacterium]|nr:alpha/beta hydrolase family protein [Fimbriimonadaceae bacterium]
MSETAIYLRKRLDSAPLQLAWKAGSDGEIAAWQVRARSEILDLLGNIDRDRDVLDPLSKPSPNGFERVSFGGVSGLRSSGYFHASPQPQPAPTVICLPGHGAGVEAIVGLREEPYQANFALQCRERGYAVLALEPVSFGDRVSDRAGPHGWSCEADAKAALMLGETLAGWRVAEAMRAVDYLNTRPEVDPTRIAIMGISGGGMISLWAAALDPRIAAAVVSGYFCTFRESILAIDHCIDNFVPGILRVMEMPDFAGLIAPRALFVESGRADTIFPISGFRAAVNRAQEIYAAFDASSRFGYEEFDGDHRFHGIGAFEFLNQRFGR